MHEPCRLRSARAPIGPSTSAGARPKGSRFRRSYQTLSDEPLSTEAGADTSDKKPLFVRQRATASQNCPYRESADCLVSGKITKHYRLIRKQNLKIDHNWKSYPAASTDFFSPGDVCLASDKLSINNGDRALLRAETATFRAPPCAWAARVAQTSMSFFERTIAKGVQDNSLLRTVINFLRVGTGEKRRWKGALLSKG